MPRRETPFLPDQYYHLYNRGTNHQAVFFERDNYLYFLKAIRKYVLGYVDVLVYFLMPTHYHLLGRVKQQTQTPEFFKNSGVLSLSDKRLYHAIPQYFPHHPGCSRRTSFPRTAVARPHRYSTAANNACLSARLKWAR